MQWLAKAALAKAGSLPAGEAVHYFVQRRLTRSLPASDAVFLRKARRAAEHLELFERHGPGRALADCVHYEFGAGWDLIRPLVLWSLGIGHQILVDIRRNARLELVAGTIARLNEHAEDLGAKFGRPLRQPGGPLQSVADLEPRFGIRYLAPCDARATGLPDAFVDFVSSTSTLEHVPEQDLPALLRECRRLLRPDGVLSCRIDLRDHFANTDRRISPYNFLRFSARTWRLINSPLLFQNRLRRSDYVAIFKAAGFQILEEAAPKPRKALLAALKELPLDESFRSRPRADLAVLSLGLVARPSPPLSPDALEELEHVGRRGRPRIGLGACSPRGGLGDSG